MVAQFSVAQFSAARLSVSPGPGRPTRSGRRRAPHAHRRACGHTSDTDPCFECFYEAHCRDFARWAAQLCGSFDVGEMSEDVFLEATRKLFETWTRTEIDEPAAYMRTILRNTACDAAAGRGVGRSRSRRQDVALDAQRLTLVGGPNPETGALRAERRRSLAAALRELPKGELDVAVCRYVLEMSATETAEHLELAPSAVSSALHRANKKLRALLDRDLLQIPDERGARHPAGGDEE